MLEKPRPKTLSTSTALCYRRCEEDGFKIKLYAHSEQPALQPEEMFRSEYNSILTQKKGHNQGAT